MIKPKYVPKEYLYKVGKRFKNIIYYCVDKLGHTQTDKQTDGQADG